MTTIRRTVGCSNRSSTIVVPTLYGRFAQQTHGSSPSSAGQSHVVASAWTISTEGRSPTVSRRPRSRPRSNSIASTRSAPASASAVVSDPSPAPISSTWTPGPTSASRAIAAAKFGSSRKFWPSAFDGRTPVASASARTAPALPAELDVEDPAPERRELLEGFGREVDDAPFAERSPVIDDHGNGAPGGRVGDGDASAERQPRVGGGQAAPRRVVPRGRAGLGGTARTRLSERPVAHRVRGRQPVLGH